MGNLREGSIVVGSWGTHARCKTGLQATQNVAEFPTMRQKQFRLLLEASNTVHLRQAIQLAKKAFSLSQQADTAICWRISSFQKAGAPNSDSK